MDAFLKMDSDLTTAVDKYRARWLDTFLLEEKEARGVEGMALKRILTDFYAGRPD